MKLEELFLNLVNLSITASYLAAAVLVLRLILGRSPRWMICLLWGMVALRLVCPISIESTFSLIPSPQPLPGELLYTASQEIPDDIQTWFCFLSRIWASGTILMLFYGLISYILLYRRVMEATKLRGNIRQSESIDSPFVLGFFCPRIYVPYKIEEADLEYVLAHEQAHIRRGDHWWKPLGFVLLAVYWFHPLLWAAYMMFCRDIETACDEKVIRGMEKEGRQAYSRALLHCGVRRRSIAACPLAFGEIGVKERIKAVMDYRKPRFWVILLTFAAIGAAAVCLLTNPVGAVDATGGKTQPSEDPGTNHQPEEWGVPIWEEMGLEYLGANEIIFIQVKER